MKVAKLSTGQIVLFLDGPKRAQFADGEHCLVSDRITTNPRRINPYWVLRTMVAWVIEFGDAI